MENEINENLLCPLSLDWFIEPVILNCCGASVSKEEIINWSKYKDNCPLCRGDLNINNLVINRNLAYLVEEAKSKGISKPSLEKRLHKQKWKAKLYRLNNINYRDTSIGRLKIECLDPNYTFKTLLIPVIDESGSMSGKPMEQVRYSLKRLVDLNYRNKNLITNMIGYSDTAKSYFLDTSKSIESNYQTCDYFGRGGGTYFSEAFREIVEVLKKFKSNVDITSVVIVFLTDGCDSTVSTNRSSMIQKLKSEIDKTWNIDYTIHSIGFTNSHDYDFINGLRLIGKKEGAYRFADPDEDIDSLSSKIFSIINKIAETSSVPIKIVDSYDMKLLSGEDNSFWMNITNVDFNNDHIVKIKINNCEEINLVVEVVEDENLVEIWNEWYSNLIDEVASEFLNIINDNPYFKLDKLDVRLHCELLIQRSKRIINYCKDEIEVARIKNLLDQINIYQKGGKIDKQKLNDLKFEGKFATEIKPKEITKSVDTLQPSAFAKKNIKLPWVVYKKPGYNISDISKYKEEVYKQVLLNSYDETKKWAFDNAEKIYKIIDEYGNNLVHLCAFIGRFGMLESFLESKLFKVNELNNDNLNALDLAILAGNFISAEILINYNYKPELSNNQIIMSCISKGYVKTLNLLFKHKLIFVYEELAMSAPSTKDEVYLRSKMESGISISFAIVKGVYDTVLEKLNSLEPMSWKEILTVFNKPTNDHVKIIDLLLKNKKLDPNEVIEWKDLDTGETDIIWPLFACCEKGNLEMLDVLMKYVDKSMINKQSLRGTTALWIACCNNKIDIIMNLLENGADPNISNFKGDSPLVPACQKGLINVVQILLEVGININSYNKNRDTPILICCRTGNYKVLEVLLNNLKSEKEVQDQLSIKADIDGFNALFASVEADKVECIKIILDKKFNIEDRTDESNEIIQGATPLHLACYYGKLKAAETLISYGADLESTTTVQKFTPLHIAIKQGHKDVVRYLLSQEKSKNSINKEDKNGKTPLYYSKMTGNEELYDEFFRNKLADILYEIIILKDPVLEKNCTDLLIKYGQSYFAYTYRDIAAITFDNNSSILSESFLTNNLYLVEKLIKVMGANINQSDDFGITPAFWMMMMDYKEIELSQVDKNSFDKLNRINSVLSNLQSKMLLKLPSYSGQLVYSKENEIPSSVVKMNYSFNSKTKNSEFINDYKEKSISLMGFMDQLKNSKNFPKNSKCLDYLLWDAKVHTIRVMASLDESYINVKPYHIMSLYLLTQNSLIFRELNDVLVNWNPDTFLKPFLYSVCQTIDLLPNYVGEIYKCVESNFLLSNYKIGDVMNWELFSFASTEWKSATELINNKKGIIFIIHSKTGKKISHLVKNQSDEDVIFKPFTKFKVINHYMASVYALGQANIRKSTFLVKENYYIKAEKQETSIIVEVEEMEDINMIN